MNQVLEVVSKENFYQIKEANSKIQKLSELLGVAVDAKSTRDVKDVVKEMLCVLDEVKVSGYKLTYLHNFVTGYKESFNESNATPWSTLTYKLMLKEFDKLIGKK